MNSQDPKRVSYNVLFVCTGNTCRSPMAEAIARAQIAERGWSHVEVASAGVSAAGGAPASEPVEPVLEEAGIPLGEHASRALTPEIIEWADSIFVMSPTHLLALGAMGGEEKAGLVTEFLEGDEGSAAVVDPIGGDVDTYRRTRDQLVRAISALLDRLEPIIAP